jgi:hypothetical protein
MTSQEFRDLLNAKSDEQLLEPCLREDVLPFVFEPKPSSWDDFRDGLVSDLGIAREDIRIVGSGRFGFSMKPEYNLRLFRDESDIDVLIVNAALFDQLWVALLTAAYPRTPLTYRLGGWLERRRNDLYTGWISPRDIQIDIRIVGAKAKPILLLRTLWFNALKRASRYPPRRHEDVRARLYRTWRHAELYHLHGLGELRRSFS